MDQEYRLHRDEGSYQLSHVRDKFLLTDDRCHRKEVLMKASNMKLKCR